MHGAISREKSLQYTLQNNYSANFAEPDNPSLLIQNLVSFPASVERYNNKDKQNEEAQANFAYEDPNLVHHEALEPTSGRKKWKIRHHKRIKKGPKKFKNGFIGEA